MKTQITIVLIDGTELKPIYTKEKAETNMKSVLALFSKNGRFPSIAAENMIIPGNLILYIFTEEVK